ncbi:SMP-30/gluconolactonase/LRE family protein [Nocardia colli]|uniref:SMP-30/gluconolactonase/LRE family protein n=1 Tax=Nocardia colli TaxID=2545717 RepID=UPI0035E31BC1
MGDLRAIALPGTGPEDVAVDAHGRLYTGVGTNQILRISPGDNVIDVIAELPARPAGIELLDDREIVVCANEAGLLAVDIHTGETRILADTVDGGPLYAVNNATVAADGTIYFTDATNEPGLTRLWTSSYPPWKEALFAAEPTGRLLRRTTDGTVEVLLDGLSFANGVTLAADESFVVVAESTARRLSRVWLTGPRRGRDELFVGGLPGEPDNLSTDSTGLIWVAISGTSVPDETGVFAFDTAGTIAFRHLDTIGILSMVSGVRRHENTLYLSSLRDPIIAAAHLITNDIARVEFGLSVTSDDSEKLGA